MVVVTRWDGICLGEVNEKLKMHFGKGKNTRMRKTANNERTDYI
jgi:hypothetical protein